MRFLLTSAGIKNTSILNALVELLGKPIAVLHRGIPRKERAGQAVGQLMSGLFFDLL